MEELTSADAREKAVETLIATAIDICRRRYGNNGFSGESYRAYHNAVHAQEVLESATQIGQLALQKGRIDANELLLVRIAAPFHDAEYSLGPSLNEDESAEIAATQVLQTGQFSEDEVRRVKGAITATKVHAENGVLVQEPTGDYISQIICDSDWSKFGASFELFWSRSLDFLRETEKTDTPTPERIKSFAGEQLLLLKSHSFYTAEAKLLFPHKADNIAR